MPWFRQSEYILGVPRCHQQFDNSHSLILARLQTTGTNRQPQDSRPKWLRSLNSGFVVDVTPRNLKWIPNMAIFKRSNLFQGPSFWASMLVFGGVFPFFLTSPYCHAKIGTSCSFSTLSRLVPWESAIVLTPGRPAKGDQKTSGDSSPL